MGKATGLKRVKGKCNVFRLQQDLHAWNVDGSSTDQPDLRALVYS